MRAFAVRRFGEAPAIHDLPVPDADDAFLIRVRYAGVNPIDNNNVGRLTADSVYPYVLGVDFAGVVERAAAPGNDLCAGDRVFGMARTHGSYAEYTVVGLGGIPGGPRSRADLSDDRDNLAHRVAQHREPG